MKDNELVPCPKCALGPRKPRGCWLCKTVKEGVPAAMVVEYSLLGLDVRRQTTNEYRRINQILELRGRHGYER